MPILRVNQDLQTAVDATPEGGTLSLGAGSLIAPSGGLLISKGIDLGGNGMNTRISAFAQGEPVIRFASDNAYTNLINGVRLHDFVIDGGKPNPTGTTASQVADGYGIKIEPGTAQLIWNVLLERLYIQSCGSHAIHIQSNPPGGAGPSCVIGLQINGCTCYANWGRGINVYGGATVLSTRGNLMSNNLDEGAVYVAVDADSCGDYYEQNCKATDLAANYAAQARYQSSALNLSKGSFENFIGNAGTETALSLYNVTGVVGGCRFSTSVAATGVTRTGIFIDNATPSFALTILPNVFDNSVDSVTSVFAGTSFPKLAVMNQSLVANADAPSIVRASGVPDGSVY